MFPEPELEGGEVIVVLNVVDETQADHPFKDLADFTDNGNGSVA